MNFKDKISSGKFVVTSEVGPPKGTDLGAVMKNVRLVKERVDAINVTDLQSSLMRLGALAVSHLLIDEGVEPIYQLTCRDRNRLALQSDILSAAVMGIKNILVLTGDHPSRGDHPEAKPVFDLDAVTLLEAIKRLNSGTDLSGKALKGSPDIFSGAVVNPGADPLEPELMKMEKKIKAGASFFQTQAIFDIKIFEDFLKEVKGFNIPIIAGVLILKSADMARYMNKNVPGVVVPDKIIEIMERSVDRERTAVDIAGGLMNDLKGMAQGVHIMPIGWDRCLIPAMDKAGL